MAKLSFDEIEWTGGDMGHWQLADGVEMHPYVPLGFVYKITRKSDGKFYIGQKKVTRLERKPPLKGKVRKRVVVKQTDWRTYNGSSGLLNLDIVSRGADEFTFEIIKFVDTKWELSYWELKYQMDYDVMFRNDTYNGIINVRLAKFQKFVDKYQNENAIKMKK